MRTWGDAHEKMAAALCRAAPQSRTTSPIADVQAVLSLRISRRTRRPRAAPAQHAWPQATPAPSRHKGTRTAASMMANAMIAYLSTSFILRGNRASTVPPGPHQQDRGHGPPREERPTWRYLERDARRHYSYRRPIACLNAVSVYRGTPDGKWRLCGDNQGLRAFLPATV